MIQVYIQLSCSPLSRLAGEQILKIGLIALRNDNDHDRHDESKKARRKMESAAFIFSIPDRRYPISRSLTMTKEKQYCS